MDTEHIVAIAVGVILLLVICFFLFLFLCGGSALAWVLARRRAHPNYEEIIDAPKACDCPPARTHCVGAEYDADDGKLVAVRVRRNACCGSGGRFDRHRLQRLVDRTDELIDEAEDQELFGQVAKMAAGMSRSSGVTNTSSSSGAPVPRGAV